MSGSILALLSQTQESCSNDGGGSRRDRLPKTVGSSRARCEQRVALFKSLATTLHCSHSFSGGVSRQSSLLTGRFLPDIGPQKAQVVLVNGTQQ
jgi:hypothetical protein